MYGSRQKEVVVWFQRSARMPLAAHTIDGIPLSALLQSSNITFTQMKVLSRVKYTWSSA